MTTSSGWKKDDAIVARSVEAGNLATGLLTLAELTGDVSCLDQWGHHITTAPDAPGDTFPPKVAAQVRAMLADAIRTRNLHGEPDIELIRRIVPYAAPELRLPEDKDFYLEQIGVGATNQLAWRKRAPDRLQDFKVVVIGAGFSGVAIARNLKRLGIPYTVYEKQRGYGGSWLTATYPGAGPDSTPNHFLSYSFAQKPDWTRYYATYEGHSEMITYLNEVIEKENLKPDIKLRTEVVQTVWNDAGKYWDIIVRNEIGREENITANVVVSASGLLAYSYVPNFPGLDKFVGDKVDVGSWLESVRLEGKRIALVGSGATANIIGPRLADMAQELRVFQRHPHWITRVEKYLREVPEGERWLLGNVPSYARWERMRAMLSTMDRYRPMTLVDPDWRSSHGTFSAPNEAFRAEMIGYINEVLGERRPELVPKMIPDYPPFSRRIIRDSGWYAARPAAIGSKVLVRIFERRIEIRDIHTAALLRTHAKAERPGTVVLPQEERVFNPSRETRLILRQADEIGVHASRLCQLLFAIEGRVGQRKLWGIVSLARRFPMHCVDAACAQALEQGVYSYKRVLALTQELFAQALQAIETASSGAPAAGERLLTQQHELIRDADEYADLFAHAAAVTATATSTLATTANTTTNNTAPAVQP